MTRAAAVCLGTLLTPVALVYDVVLPVRASFAQEAGKPAPGERADDAAPGRHAVGPALPLVPSEKPAEQTTPSHSPDRAGRANEPRPAAKDSASGGTTKGSTARASTASVRPFLVGSYSNAYYRLSDDPLADKVKTVSTTLPLRFFAAQFELPASEDPAQPARDLTKYEGDLYRALNRKASDAAQSVDRNSISLAPNGVIDPGNFGADSWIVFGVSCPVHAELHWLACGRHMRLERYEVMSNSRGGEELHVRSRGWESRTHASRLRVFPFPPDYWTVALVEGGAVAESFQTRREEESCGVELRLAMPRGEATVRYAFVGPAISVGLVGDYERISGRSLPSLDSDQIRSLAVMASQRSDGGPTDRFLANVVLSGEAARLARDVTLAEGYTLSSPSTLRRFELAEGKVVVIAAYNPARDRTSALAFRQSHDSLLWRPCGLTRDAQPHLTSWEALREGMTLLELEPASSSAAKVCAKWSYANPGVLEVMILGSP
jgi:hypothetical protein